LRRKRRIIMTNPKQKHTKKKKDKRNPRKPKKEYVRNCCVKQEFCAGGRVLFLNQREKEK